MNKMKKEYLDYLYGLKSRIEADIDRLGKQTNNPTVQCCENMSSESEAMAELRTRRSQLSSLDETISNYLEIHK